MKIVLDTNGEDYLKVETPAGEVIISTERKSGQYCQMIVTVFPGEHLVLEFDHQLANEKTGDAQLGEITVRGYKEK